MRWPYRSGSASARYGSVSAEDAGTRGEATAAPGGRNWAGTARIVVGNAIPVIGVWFLGWQALPPIFFYWLDGLLAIWGLGVVAFVVTSRDDSRLLGGSGPKAWLQRAAALGLVLLVLAVPSGVAAGLVIDWLNLSTGRILTEVFAFAGAWVSLAIAVWANVGGVVGELRWRPDQTLGASGEARANFFIHRTLVLGILAAWGGRTPPRHWALAAYVLVVAVLFTYTQLYPERYLHLIGFRKRARQGRTDRGRRRRGAGRSGEEDASTGGEGINGRSR